MKHIKLLCSIIMFSIIASCSNDMDMTSLNSENYSLEENGRILELPNGMIVEKKDSFYVFQGDIYYTEDDIKQLKKSRACTRTNASNKWGYVIPYEVASNFTDNARIDSALAHWSQATNLAFVRRTDQSSYIRFEEHTSPDNAGTMGYGRPSSGARVIKIGSSRSSGIIMHEIGHALGLLHEHCRPDRDTYVDIKYDNIKTDFLHDFERYTGNVISSNKTDFDYNSIMIYASIGSEAAKNRELPVMTRKDQPNTAINGQRSFLSPQDIELFNRLYPENKYRITGEAYPDETAIYSYRVNASNDATVNWRLSDRSGAILLRLQDPHSIRVIMPERDGQFVLYADILSPLGYPQKTTSFVISKSSYCPQIRDINMFKYCQGTGEYTLQAFVNQTDVNISWTTDGTIYDIPYPDDAMFLENPHLFAAVDFYNTGDHTVYATASNQRGESTFCKTFYVEDAKSRSMLLSPNPCYDGIVMMEIKGNDEQVSEKKARLEKTINVYSNGKIVFTKKLYSNKEKIDLSDLADGRYLIEYIESSDKKLRQILYINRKQSYN